MTTNFKIVVGNIHPNDEVVLEVVDDTLDGTKLVSEEILEVGISREITIWDTRSIIISERKKAIG